VPEADVAAALAVVAQGETPLLLSPDDARFQRQERQERGDRERGATGERPERRGRSTKPMSPYRIEVGKRHRVEPRQIVGALANEGGLSRDDFGHIQIRPDFSIVELPADMPGNILAKLKDTRISGKLIEIKPDRRAAPRRGDREGRPARKPRDG
jgi:ATP-dependent RNA helicase DeaD